MDENEREGRIVRRVPQDTFGHRVMLARSEAGNLTIDIAATKCGLHPQNWSNWEKGKVPRDKVEVAEAIAEGLDIDRDWLLFGGPLSPARPRRVQGPVSMRYPTPSRPQGRRARRLRPSRARMAA